MQAIIPPDWRGSEVVAVVDLGGADMVGFTAEGLVWDGDQPRQGLHLKHRDYVVARPAVGGEVVELSIEAAANPIPPWGTSRWPLLMPDVDGPAIYRLGAADLAVVRRDVEALYFDMLVLVQLLAVLPDDGSRAIAGCRRARVGLRRDRARRRCRVGIDGARRARAGARARGPARRAPHDRDRARAHRFRLAVADARDQAQVRADVRQRAAPHGGLSRVPVLRVTGPAVRLDERALPAAVRPHARPGGGRSVRADREHVGRGRLQHPVG